jgi:hypothetical protein
VDIFHPEKIKKAEGSRWWGLTKKLDFPLFRVSNKRIYQKGK